jgi:ATP-binding cassette subfamily F protein uup
MSAAQFLEKFLFPRDMHYHFVHKLSGGEKRRLKMMTVLMKNPNFLILDEPTNDLDIFVMSVLEDYLRSFDGCLVVVSHDRYFMDKMVDHLFVFQGQGKIKDLVGNYTEYRKDLLSSDKETKVTTFKDLPAEIVIDKPKEHIKTDKRKLTYKEKSEFETLEKELSDLENKKEILTNILSDPSKSNQEVIDAGNELSKIVCSIDEKTERWLELSELI